ncbi:hybrid signal transduction histidine kinase E-like [Varroa jacobsoni]|uniref:hybrid signal transduction histidine kinase E-like n=1 Tax=Varroa jacobsoni TaxID=62625 RepID=UPI000BF347CE|nr:hybrid signal transduction histidine kinase E-like [Varroa jacobsoni]
MALTEVMLQLCQPGGPLSLGGAGSAGALGGLAVGVGGLVSSTGPNGSPSASAGCPLNAASPGATSGNGSPGEPLGSPLVVRRRRQWRESETMLFIRSWERHHEALKSHRRNAHIYEKMRDELSANGLSVTTQQIRVKIDNLTQAYRRTMRGAPLRGGDIRWFQYMHRFLGDNFVYQSDSSDEPVALVCPKRSSSAIVSSQSSGSTGPQLTGAAGAADLPDPLGPTAAGRDAEISSSLKPPRITGSEPSSEVTSSYVDEERNCSTTPLSSCSSGSAVLQALQTSLAVHASVTAASPETTTPTPASSSLNSNCGIGKESINIDNDAFPCKESNIDGSSSNNNNNKNNDNGINGNTSAPTINNHIDNLIQGAKETEQRGGDLDTEEEMAEDTKRPLAVLPPIPPALPGLHNLPLSLSLDPVVVSAKKFLRLNSAASSANSGSLANGSAIHSDSIRRPGTCGNVVRKKCCHHPDVLSRKLVSSVERMLQAQLLVAQQALVSQQQLQQAILGQQQLMQCLVALQDSSNHRQQQQQQQQQRDNTS